MEDILICIVSELNRVESFCCDSQPVMSASLRRFRPDDIGALRDICLRTSADGRDATDLVTSPDLPGDVYAAPYGVLEPTTSLVLDNGSGDVVGYVVAALDTAAFEARCEAAWWPKMRKRHPQSSGTRALDEFFLGLVHEPPTADPSVLVLHPSHLHINLLPEMQGSGWGRSMIEAILELLASEGSTGLHLGVSAHNEPAQKFYARLGFKRLHGDNNEPQFGISLND
jgi:ribosomal protein S18 acetylase RimI-like enzyme